MGAAVGQNAILPWNLGVGSIPTLASISNRVCGNDLGGRESATDTKTDIYFTTP